MYELIDKVNKMHMRDKLPEIHTGDKVRVHQKIREGKKERIQMFEGVVVKVIGGSSINSSFTVRRIASGVGVEKSFPLHLPTLVKVERLKSAKVKQARIYYVRGRIGKRASRMKNEKTADGVWEDLAVEEDKGPVEVPQAEIDAMRASENAEEKSESNSASEEASLDKGDASESNQPKSIPDPIVETSKKEEHKKHPKTDRSKTTPNHP